LPVCSDPREFLPWQEMQERIYNESHKWLREARASIRAMAKSTSSSGPGTSGTVRLSKLEPIPLPTFSGKPEEWADFKRVFLDLTGAEGYSDTLLLAQLRPRLPAEAQQLIRGITIVEEAWNRLGERYGNRTLAIITAKNQLINLKTGGGQPHEQLEALLQGVRQALTALRAVQADETLFADFSLISLLLRKVSRNHQERWHLFSTSQDFLEDDGSEGVKFCSWLEREGKAAQAARLTKLSGDLALQPTTQHPTTQPTVNKSPKTTLGTNGNPSELQTFAVDGRPTWVDQVATKEGAIKMAEEVKTRHGSCPLCKDDHTYPRALPWGTMEWPSQRLEACPQFQQMTPQARGNALEEQGGCSLCTSYAHPKNKCFQTDKRKPNYKPVLCSEKVNGSKSCGKSHHSLLHGSASIYCQTNAAMARSSSSLQTRKSTGGKEMGSSRKKGTIYTAQETPPAFPKDPSQYIFSNQEFLEQARNCMFEFVVAPVGSNKGLQEERIIFTDPGSNVNFVRMDVAPQLKLEGRVI
jgi:hypothetical protein